MFYVYFYSYSKRSSEREKNKEDFFEKLQEKLPNLPLIYWQKNKERNSSRDCDKIPDILDIQYNNDYWQVKQTENNTFYLHAAYFDNRKIIFQFEFDFIKWWHFQENIIFIFQIKNISSRAANPGPSVRILGIIKDEIKQEIPFSRLK